MPLHSAVPREDGGIDWDEPLSAAAATAAAGAGAQGGSPGAGGAAASGGAAAVAAAAGAHSDAAGLLLSLSEAALRAGFRDIAVAALQRLAANPRVRSGDALATFLF